MTITPIAATAEGGCGGCCGFLRSVTHQGDPDAVEVHDRLVADLGGEHGLAGLVRALEHLELAGDFETDGPCLHPVDLLDFVAEHNWPDPVATTAIARRVGYWQEARAEVRRSVVPMETITG